MKITMRVTAAGPEGVKLAGSTYDVSELEAKSFVDGGYAVVAPLAAKPAPKAAPAKPAAAKDYVPAPEPDAVKEPSPVKEPAVAGAKKNRA